MTTTNPPSRDTATVPPPPVRERPPEVEKPKARRRRMTRWLAWMGALVVVAAAITIGIVVAQDDAEPVWTATELEDLAQTYAGDLVEIPRTPYSTQMQALLFQIASSYAGDLDPQPLTPGHSTYWSQLAETYAGDVEPGLDAPRNALLERLAEIAATYADGDAVAP
jgi:hypothetical protein